MLFLTFSKFFHENFVLDEFLLKLAQLKSENSISDAISETLWTLSENDF